MVEFELFAFEGAGDQVGTHLVSHLILRCMERADQIDQPQPAAALGLRHSSHSTVH
ncbi:hypothetical protein [Paremcibacter congregatus]|uniref:hypothetical protein n=1 Tax=Paremcibacter congregatus TaxID=2043170 RepID=UPI003A8DFE90